MHEFRDLTGVTRIAVIAVYAYLAIDVVYGLVMLAELMSPPELGSPRFTLGTMLGLVSLVVFLGSAIVVGRWIYRATANAHALSDEMTVSPGLAVGSYFIPILNLFKPFQGMKEAWLASHHRSNWHGEPTPGLLIVWWTLWLVTNILGNVSLRMSMENEDGSLTGAVATIEVLTSLLNLPLCLVLVAMMKRLARAQNHARYDHTFT